MSIGPQGLPEVIESKDKYDTCTSCYGSRDGTYPIVSRFWKVQLGGLTVILCDECAAEITAKTQEPK